MNGHQLIRCGRLQHNERTETHKMWKPSSILAPPSQKMTGHRLRLRSGLQVVMSAMAGFSKIWKSKDVSFCTKRKLFRSLVLSSTSLYGCQARVGRWQQMWRRGFRYLRHAGCSTSPAPGSNTRPASRSATKWQLLRYPKNRSLQS